MKVKVQQGDYMRREIAVADDITYIVIFADDDTPVMAIEQVGRDHIQVTRAGDKLFPHILHRLGVEVGKVSA